jgi:hypothetical protein
MGELIAGRPTPADATPYNERSDAAAPHPILAVRMELLRPHDVIE